MTLPSSGVMTAAMINVELGRASNAVFNINGSAERALAGVPSGTIRFSDFYGKSAGGAITVTMNGGNETINGSGDGTGFSGKSITVTGGVASSYNWGFTGVDAGTWVVSGGQGTAAATASVSGVPTGTLATANFVCDTIVSGTNYRRSVVLQYNRAGAVSVGIIGGDESASGGADGFTTGPKMIQVTGGVASSYNWGFTGGSGGTWAVASGQGTASATASVTGVAASTPASATFFCDTVVNGTGYRRSVNIQYTRTSAGTVTVSISPQEDQYLSGIGPGGAAVWTPRTITVTGGTATSYTWGFTPGPGTGTWAVASGQSTATATPAVSAVPLGRTKQATFWCDVVVAGTTYRRQINILEYARDPA